MRPIRVLLADDHAILRAGLKNLIEAQPDMEVVGEAASGEQTLQRASRCDANVITLDVSMPGPTGVPLIEELRRICPGARLLVLTMHDDPAYARAYLAAGCSGYVVKTTALSEFLTAIRAIHQGESYLDAHLKRALAAPPAAPPSDPAVASDSPVAILSQREREVLQGLAEGHSYQHLANRLYLSVKTIETYRARIFQKLNFRTRADLVRFALEQGIIAPGRTEAASGS